MKLIQRLLFLIIAVCMVSSVAIATDALKFSGTPTVTSNGGELIVTYSLNRKPTTTEKAVIKVYEVGGATNSAITSFDVTDTFTPGQITIGSHEYTKVSTQLVVNGAQSDIVQETVNNPVDTTTFSSPTLEATPVTGGLDYGQGADTTKFDGLQSYLDKVYPIALRFAVVFAVLIIMFSGVQYIISQGNDQALTAAKGRITNAIIGLILLILATTIFSIVRQRVNIAPSTPSTSSSASASGSGTSGGTTTSARSQAQSYYTEHKAGKDLSVGPCLGSFTGSDGKVYWVDVAHSPRNSSVDDLSANQCHGSSGQNWIELNPLGDFIRESQFQ